MPAPRDRLFICGVWAVVRVVLVVVVVLVFLSIYGKYIVMRTNPQTIFHAAIAASFTRHGKARSTVDLGWYAPNATEINDLKKVLEGDGTYAFIYNSSTTSANEYDTYNWCNMPHVRATEYKKPSVEYKLQYVEVIHRHHKRTVYASNSFPVELYGWNCDDEALFHYGAPKAGKQPAHVYWQGYISPVNLFVPTGFLGSCQFPRVTREGLEDSWQHGEDLYGVYHDMLGFLPDTANEKVAFRVTQNVITSEVASMVLNGMFKIEEAYPLLIQPQGYDSLEPGYSCATSSSLLHAIRSGSNWTNHLTAASSLFASLDNISRVPPTDAGFHASFDHYYDNLSARQCHGKPLPCKLVGGLNSTTCVNQDLANKVYRLGNYEYSYIYREDPRSLAAFSAGYGVWVGELTSHIRELINGTSKVIYRHKVAHDGPVSMLLSLLQLDFMVWPGMGAEVVFELYQKDASRSPSSAFAAPTSSPRHSPGSSSYYMRVLWKGQVLRSSNPSLGLMDMVPLDTFLAYFDGLVGIGAGLVKCKCDGSTPV